MSKADLQLTHDDVIEIYRDYLEDIREIIVKEGIKRKNVIFVDFTSTRMLTLNDHVITGSARARPSRTGLACHGGRTLCSPRSTASGRR